ncbi:MULTISPECIES: hypothetical protein [Sanguibacteroides]|mgnify:FL=1|uniref:Uncharacterized protein n=1 Tax=Sanguibacteroides justesenii TaxID=1547597 RepID=A0A0C3NFN0_9PORP|nr:MULTISPECIES: hypothetical protein [Sanguibacteroides]KIO43206.1 hypothetical protein IE90_13455 [Sanguibacteroides justesenii]KIO44922.1 hypothetical protein BA92_07855 [Sanguibacteroides justesenii]PXZ43143.1 hypothetical protein DMB45_12195 [Sanguibacteroides justesenii]
MPYRRLPNTDAARIRALETALKNEASSDFNDLPFSPSLKQKIEFFLPKFKTAITNSQVARDKQNVNSRKYAEYTRKAKLYISHFLQVLNFTIARGELKSSARTFYGLDENNSKLPPLISEQDLLEWGAKIINGEQERTRNGGGNPVYSPSIALVKVNYENFKQGYASQKQFQQNSARCCAEVAQFRSEADEYILTLWNEIENYYMEIEDEEERRKKCEYYGLIYVFRRGEKERIKRQKEAERITLKLPF